MFHLALVRLSDVNLSGLQMDKVSELKDDCSVDRTKKSGLLGVDGGSEVQCREMRDTRAAGCYLYHYTPS